MYLDRVKNNELDLCDMAWLAEIVSLLPFGNTARDWAEDSSLHFWRPTNGGLVVTRVREHPDGKEFQVMGLAGSAMRPKALKLALEVLAKACGARWWSAEVVNPGVAGVLEHWGLAPYSLTLLKEI